jgi:hypothetical protein
MGKSVSHFKVLGKLGKWENGKFFIDLSLPVII